MMRLPKLRTILILVVLGVSCCFCWGQTQSELETGVEGVITIGPIHGGPSVEGIPSSKPLANTAFVVENEKGIVTSFTTDDEGRFRISLTPGHYTVSITEKKIGIGRYGPFDVDVVAGKMTKVEWQCDTGMR